MRAAKITLGLATILLSSCALLAPEDPLTYLHFDAEAWVEPGFVHYTLLVTNGSREEVTLYPGGCGNGPNLQVYDIEGRLVWESNPEVLPPNVICAAVLITYRIPAGETIRIESRARVGQILGSSLPEGRYRLVMEPRFGRPSDASIPLGEFTLERESD